MVNGPEGQPEQGRAVEGDNIDWRSCEEQVRRIRRRIFTATRDGDWPRVRNLQRLMLRSRANTLVSVRQVTQRNAGRRTAGLDQEVALTSQARADVAERVHRSILTWEPVAVRRVYIPKARDRRKLRPLGIPVIMDRCHQARVRNALEPEWEARAEPRSYGFRPGRSCQDAIQAIFNTLGNKTAKRVWILDADLAAAFDHDRLLASIGDFPARGMIAGWLKAGVVEPGKGFAPTEQGTPQGGVISPLLLNVALHGLEQAAGVRYQMTGVDAGKTERNSPVLIRYADDLVACCHSRQQTEQVKARLAGWLAPRGLSFNEDKTRIVHLDDGFDFLGVNIRRYRRNKLLIKPSTPAVRRLRERLATETRILRGSNATAVIAKLNPIIRGWAAYYRTVVASETFSALDHHLWWLIYRWARHTHPNKPKKWINARYYGTFNKSRNDRWVFGDRDSGAYLLRFAWTSIVRHQQVPGAASPDDPALADYWNKRRRHNTLPLDGHAQHLLTKQDGHRPLCGEPLLTADQPPQTPHEWEQWWQTVTRRTIPRGNPAHGPDQPTDGTPDEQKRLIHTTCHRTQQRRTPQPQPRTP